MFFQDCVRKRDFPFLLWKLMFSFGLLIALQLTLIDNLYSQQFQQQYFAPQQNQNYMRNSSAFRQEIARFEMTVYREGKQPLPLSQVPRVQQGDMIKVRLLDEAVNGVKLDQSLYNWTMLLAFINPNRKISEKSGSNNSSNLNSKLNAYSNSFVDNNSNKISKSPDKESSVSQEVVFRKTGWYKEYSFTVPYDSQPIFFLYPRPGYRSKLLSLINKNHKELKALGEKTIEIAGAYGQISLFLNELQGVISGNNYNGYGNGYGSGYGSGYGNGSNYGGSTGGYNNYGGYNTYNPYNNNNRNSYPGYNQAYNYNLLLAQSVERMARAFNISLPNNCWQGSQQFANSTYYGGYNNYSGGYNNYNGYNGSNNTLQNIFQPQINPELVGRLQCVAKSIRLEDFDVSVSKLLQQGGMLLAVQLQQKYPQLSYWINVAALAIDLIVKITKKSPLRIVTTITSSSDIPNSGSYTGGYGNGGSYTSGNYNSGNYPNNFNSNYPNSGMSPNSSPNPSYSSNPANSTNLNNQQMPKVSLFAESQPDDNQFVTAYPIVLHKWQPEADGEVISLRPPILAEPCLHAGVNILKSTDLTDAQINDNFTKGYVLTMTATNGFRKEFSLKKNLGLNGWELNITLQDLQDFPKIQMNVESTIKGTRGFNEIKSPPFYLPISIGGSWQITPESQQNLMVGGKRIITLRNSLGNCQCLQAVIYKPSFGGQFVFEADDKEHGLQYSPDGKEVSFELDTANFQAGQGEIELKTYGGESAKLNLKLYPALPNITNLKIGKGDREAIISGERLEQIQSVKINSKRAFILGNQTRGNNANQPQNNENQPNYQNSSNYQIPNQPNYGNQSNGVNSYSKTTPNQTYSTGSSSSNNYIPNLQANNSNERVIVFEDANSKITENTALIELGLEDNRTMQVKQTFQVSPSRPTITSNENKEVEGVAIANPKSQALSPKLVSQPQNIRDQRPKAKDQPQLDLGKLAVFPIDTSEIVFNVQNTLTDYDFRVENLAIETRLEKKPANNPTIYNNGANSYGNYGGETALPKVEFEVLDWKNLRITFHLSEQVQKLLGGRRLQFRFKDKERGDSDWYSIKQTFVRIPEISSINCTTEMNGMCEMKGASIDYISQVSIDGGQTWYPNEPATLQVQSTPDGQKLAMIPNLQNKKLLMIKLRDFPKGDGLFINGFTFSNTAKVKPIKQINAQTPPINQAANGSLNQPIQLNQKPLGVQNQTSSRKSKVGKRKKS